MKRTFLTMAAIGAFAMTVKAQTLNVVVGNVTYALPASQAGDMNYSGGTQLNIMGKTVGTADITRMYVDNSDVEDNTVSISYNGTSASVTVAGNVAQYVTPSISGAHVTIVQSKDVDETTCGEITYILSGTSPDGSFTLDGSYKASIELNGLSLTSTLGAPLDLQDGKRISLSIKKGTENTLYDSADGTQKGCIVSKGHLELKGKGTLNIYGNTAHAIYSKEYVELKNATVNVLSAVKDGINCNQYFSMESGSLTVTGVQDDGIQVAYKDDIDREEEDSGSIAISGGSVNISTTGTATKGLKAEGDVIVSSGDINITTSGGGKWDADEAKTKAAACISADGDVRIYGGNVSLAASGSGGKGISCDGEFVCNDGTIGISTTGGMYAYINNTEYNDYTGNTDNLSSDQKSSPKGIKADGNVTVNGGNISVSVTGNGGEGIESKAVMTINGGNITANTSDDALNSSSHMYIKGGQVTVVATGNDGIDSNGNLYIQGGTIMAFGTTSPECGIDANEEEGYSVIFTGGTLLAVGGGNSVPSSSESTQPYVTSSMSVTANTEITLMDGDTKLASFTVPDNYTAQTGGSGNRPGGWGTSAKAAPGGMGGGPGDGPGGNSGGGPGGNSGGSSILVTCPGMTSGSSYTITSGSSSSTVTAVLTGNNSGGGGRPW